tara:strand:+ start:4511 stop:4699 length:189 start_codon:yes stop_codon:yes gene_type:complete
MYTHLELRSDPDKVEWVELGCDDISSGISGKMEINNGDSLIHTRVSYDNNRCQELKETIKGE